MYILSTAYYSVRFYVFLKFSNRACDFSSVNILLSLGQPIRYLQDNEVKDEYFFLWWVNSLYSHCPNRKLTNDNIELQMNSVVVEASLL